MLPIAKSRRSVVDIPAVIELGLLSHSRWITAVTPDAAVQLSDASYAGTAVSSTYPETSGASGAWAEGTAGAGVTVAVLDTGVSPVPDLAGQTCVLSNKGIDVAALTPGWGRFVLGGRAEVIVALDWTEFDDDDHATICAYAVTTHGRATPLIWRTVKKSELKDHRTEHEHALIERLHEAIPRKIGVTLLGDRGFGDYW